MKRWSKNLQMIEWSQVKKYQNDSQVKLKQKKKQQIYLNTRTTLILVSLLIKKFSLKAKQNFQR